MLKGKRVNSLGFPKHEVLQKPMCSQLGPIGLPIAHTGPPRRCPHVSLDKPDIVAKPTIVLSWRKPAEVELFSRKAHIAAEQRNSQRKSGAQPEQSSPVLSPLPSASHTHSSSCLPHLLLLSHLCPPLFCSPEPLALKALTASHDIALGQGRRGREREAWPAKKEKWQKESNKKKQSSKTHDLQRKV